MKKNIRSLIIIMLGLLIVIPVVSIKVSSADVGEIYLNQNSMYGTDSSNIQFQYKAEKASSAQCSPVKGKIAPSKAQKRPPLERNITPQILTQKMISNNQFQDKLNKDIKLKNITNYANNIGYVPFENGTQEITYDNGIKAIIAPMQLKNKSQENKAVFIVSVSQTDASNFPFIAKFEEENGTLLLTMFNDEGGIVIDVFNNSLKSSWALHHSCEYWTCVWYAIQYYLETPGGDICEHVCFHCSITLELVPFCSVCIGCIIGMGGAGLLNCAGDNCLFYPCQYDCDDDDGYYGSQWEYHCVNSDRYKHRLYYDYYCPTEEPGEGSCSYNTDYVDDTYVETCDYGCNQATGNCYGATTCYDDPDCGDDGWVGSTSCSGGNVWQDWREYTCYNPGTENSYCDYDDTSTLKQICSSGDCVSGQCEESSSCEEYYPDYPWWCNENCWGCELGNEDRSICCPDSGDPDWCCLDTGPYCDSSTGECTVCGGDYPWECNDGCWGCPSGGDLCCPTSGDPEWCCYTEIGSVCMNDGGCCLPSTETCNNQDDDCDGTIDSFSEGCGVGACAGGTRTCTSGSWGSCSTAGLATDETCNNIDDDCDGSVDESLSQECGTDIGTCVKGTQTCSAGNWGECGGSYVGPTDEVCNGIDDNCNNMTDEQNVCNNSIVINLEFPENNSVEYSNSTPTFGFNITNVNYTYFNCSLWLDNGTPTTYANDSVLINVGTSWNLTANRTVPDDTYYWWINCTDGVNLNISEKRIITVGLKQDGQSCTQNSECVSNNCRKEIDSAGTYCAATNKECSEGVADHQGYDSGEVGDQSNSDWLCRSQDTSTQCTSSTQCDEYNDKYCDGVNTWSSGDSYHLDAACALCTWCGGTAGTDGDISCVNQASGDAFDDCAESCSGYTHIDGDCDGSGACNTGVVCANYLDCADATSCNTACTDQSNCRSNSYYCNAAGTGCNSDVTDCNTPTDYYSGTVNEACVGGYGRQDWDSTYFCTDDSTGCVTDNTGSCNERAHGYEACDGDNDRVCSNGVWGSQNSCPDQTCTGAANSDSYLTDSTCAESTGCSTQTSTECSACQTCSGTSCVNYGDNTQDSIGSNTCDSTCAACQSGSCSNANVDTDPGSQCGVVECDDGGSLPYYYHDWVSLTCYYKDDVAAADADCDGSGSCKTDAVECAEEGQGDTTGVSCDCEAAEIGCSGTTSGSCDNGLCDIDYDYIINKG